jgi:hypothetical protein
MREAIVAQIGLDKSCGAKSLLGECFRALFRGGGEMDRRQKGADQQHQQVDFHAFLRCFLLAQ